MGLIDWKELAKKQGFDSDYQMLLHFRRRNVSSIRIARKLGISDMTVRRRMEKINIQRLPARAPKSIVKILRKKRDFGEFVRRYNRKNEKDLFYWLYWTRYMSPVEMGRLLKCPSGTITTRLKANGIARRGRGPRKNIQREGGRR